MRKFFGLMVLLAIASAVTACGTVEPYYTAPALRSPALSPSANPAGPSGYYPYTYGSPPVKTYPSYDYDSAPTSDYSPYGSPYDQNYPSSDGSHPYQDYSSTSPSHSSSDWKNYDDYGSDHDDHYDSGYYSGYNRRYGGYNAWRFPLTIWPRIGFYNGNSYGGTGLYYDFGSGSLGFSPYFFFGL